MVRFKQGQKCFVYFNNNWNISKVIDLDASLVKFATTNDDTFWMYRGSFCLWPIYEKLFKLQYSEILGKIHFWLFFRCSWYA